MPILSSCSFVRRSGSPAKSRTCSGCACATFAHDSLAVRFVGQAVPLGESHVQMMSSPMLATDEVPLPPFAHAWPAQTPLHAGGTDLGACSPPPQSFRDSFEALRARWRRQVLVTLTWKGELPLTLTLATPTPMGGRRRAGRDRTSRLQF
jgi:hypothetical protein